MNAVVVDSNLLLLLVVGMTSQAYISMHRRLRAYTEADFILLQEILSAASKIVVTPNILTETSNLLGYIAEPARTRVFAMFRAFVQAVEEQYVESNEAAARDEFVRLGLTDAAMLQLAAASHTLLTSDLALYLGALNCGYRAQNFNHLRGL